MFVGGILCLLAGAQLLVKSSSTLAVHFGIPALVVGVTVVAFATSAPEIAVSIDTILSKRPAMALGNVVGSNIANILLILGISALISPITIHRKIIRQEILLMILSGGLLFVMGWNGAIRPFEGAILLVLFTAFILFQIHQARKEQEAAGVDQEQQITPTSPWLQGILLVAGLGLLILGARWLVASAVEIARFWGMSELVIGLTIIAAGTSLPEVATSVIAAFKGKSDLSVGNVVGSNIFNILLVLGLSAFFSSGGLKVSSAALSLDIPLMIAASIACLPIFFTGLKIERWEGALFLGYYIAYLTYLFLDTTQHEYLPLFNNIMLLFVMPLTVLTLGILVYRSWKSGGQEE